MQNIIFDINESIGIALVGSGSLGGGWRFHYEPLPVCRHLQRIRYGTEGGLDSSILHQAHITACITRDKADLHGLTLGPYEKPARGWEDYDAVRSITTRR
jgi:hypothetical protein